MVTKLSFGSLFLFGLFVLDMPCYEGTQSTSRDHMFTLWTAVPADFSVNGQHQPPDL